MRDLHSSVTRAVAIACATYSADNTPAAVDPGRRGLIDTDQALAAWSDQAMPAPPVTP